MGAHDLVLAAEDPIEKIEHVRLVIHDEQSARHGPPLKHRPFSGPFATAPGRKICGSIDFR
jgi:hypothetical protein